MEADAEHLVSIPLAILRRCVMKAERVYQGHQPDAAPGECWAEVEAVTTWLDDDAPGWREGDLHD